MISNTKIIFVCFLVAVFGFSFFANTTFAQSGCSIEILTPVVNVGERARIKINNPPLSSGNNATFNIYSPRTEKWVDVGNQIIAANGNSLELSLLNDNDGNPLFVEGVTGNTVILRQAGIVGTQTYLCGSLNTIVVRIEPVQNGKVLCKTCSGTELCDPSFTCISGRCIPDTSKQEGAGCINNDQCDQLQNLQCVGSLWPSAWCDQAPTGANNLPGVCTPRPVEPAIFNCGNRGGQCSGLPLEDTCIDGRIRSDCDGTKQCWIHPTNSSGQGNNLGDIGSCVTQRQQNCGVYGATCCENTSGGHYCTEGTPVISAGETLLTCSCAGGNKDLGDSCTNNNQCNSDFCLNGRCGVNNQCIQAPTGVGAGFCQSLGGILCHQDPTPSDIDGTDHCCPSRGMCEQLGGEAKGDNYLCFIDGAPSIDTAIGCIPLVNVSSIIQFFIRWALGVVGGIAILMLIFGSLKIMISKGDPDGLISGKEIINSTIIAVFIMIFCLILLRFIGVNILGFF